MEKKIHKNGWFRSFYYYLGWNYESKNDKPTEKSIKIKQECMRQISLSKLKLNVIKKKERIAPDLLPICNMNTPLKKHQNHIDKKYKHIGRNQLLYYDYDW